MEAVTTTPTSSRPPLVVRLGAVTAGSLVIWLLMGWMSDNRYAGLSATAQHAANAAVVFLLAVPMVVAARRYLDRRPWSGLRLTGVREGWWPFLVGAIAWLVPALIGITVGVWAGWVEIDLVGTPAGLVQVLLLLTVLVLVFEAVPEELLMRGYVFRNLSAAMAPWLAVAVQALIFAAFGTALWVIQEGWSVGLERMMIFVGMGVVLGCIRVMADNVWACIGFHLAFQVMAQMVLSTRHDAFVLQGENALMLVSFLPAFVLGATIVGLLIRRDENWRVPEPDTAEA